MKYCISHGHKNCKTLNIYEIFTYSIIYANRKTATSAALSMNTRKSYGLIFIGLLRGKSCEQ